MRCPFKLCVPEEFTKEELKLHLTMKHSRVGVAIELVELMDRISND